MRLTAAGLVTPTRIKKDRQLASCRLAESSWWCTTMGKGEFGVDSLADSVDQIHARYPALEVVQIRPPWMDEEFEARVRVVDVDDSQDEFLKALRDQP